MDLSTSSEYLCDRNVFTKIDLKKLKEWYQNTMMES